MPEDNVLMHIRLLPIKLVNFCQKEIRKPRV